MKTIIAGSRTIQNYSLIEESVKACGWKITEVVNGLARGVDALGGRWAKEHDVSIKEFPADWDKYGKRAGFLRNEQMAKYAEALILVWDGESRGKGTESRSNRRRRPFPVRSPPACRYRANAPGWCCRSRTAWPSSPKTSTLRAENTSWRSD